MPDDARELAAFHASWEFSEQFLTEDAAILTARARGEEFNATPIGAGGGAALHFLATLLDAGHVVEVGTGAGVSGLWLLRGMREHGVLTTVDINAEHHRVARETFSAADIDPSRVRLITGRALDVLPRLTDAAYDLVFLDGDKTEYALYLEQAVRLLRPGGIVAFDNALWHNRVADPAKRDASTLAIRALVNAVREDERLTSVLLPVGDGLLCAQVRPTASPSESS